MVYLAAETVRSPVITRGWSFVPATGIARWHLRRQVLGAELRVWLTPTYPIGCKRVVIDSSFYPALANVQLVTDGTPRITPDGIEGKDWTHRRVDTIVYAAGFRPTEFLIPMEVYGGEGFSLNEEWTHGAEAYLGMATRGFPCACRPIRSRFAQKSWLVIVDGWTRQSRRPCGQRVATPGTRPNPAG
jgi:cation diffusion facilitator CzcD-associated flavoprotein CzcO